MTENVLVCGGLPRAATTFLYTELGNYTNVHQSIIKESYLFERNEKFIDSKINALEKRIIYLDFTPDYIFNPQAIRRIKDRNISCFFILREYTSWRVSIERYLTINRIKNHFLLRISEHQFRRSIDYAQDNFLTFSVDDIAKRKDEVLEKIQLRFHLDFGERLGDKFEKNASDARIHIFGSYIYNNFHPLEKIVKSTLFGIV